MVEEFLQSAYPRRPTDYSEVKPDRQHARRGFSLFVKAFKRIDAISCKIIAEDKSAAIEETHVICIERIRENDMITLADFYDIWRIVVISIGIIQETPVLSQ